MTPTNAPLIYKNTVLCHFSMYRLSENGMTPKHVGAI